MNWSVTQHHIVILRGCKSLEWVCFVFATAQDIQLCLLLHSAQNEPCLTLTVLKQNLEFDYAEYRL